MPPPSRCQGGGRGCQMPPPSHCQSPAMGCQMPPPSHCQSVLGDVDKNKLGRRIAVSSENFPMFSGWTGRMFSR